MHLERHGQKWWQRTSMKRHSSQMIVKQKKNSPEVESKKLKRSWREDDGKEVKEEEKNRCERVWGSNETEVFLAPPLKRLSFDSAQDSSINFSGFASTTTQGSSFTDGHPRERESQVRERDFWKFVSKRQSNDCNQRLVRSSSVNLYHTWLDKKRRF